MKQVDIINGIMRIDTNTESFDMQKIQNRRFMYNPQTGTLLLGVQFRGNEILYSHAEEYHRIGIREDFDRFVRGWVGTGKSYKQGVIHFAPNVPASVPELFNKGFDTLEMFKRNNANAKTVVRGFGSRWEQPLSDIVQTKEVDLMTDKQNINVDKDAITTRQTAVLTAEPPKAVTPIELKASTQKEKLQEITDKLEQGVKDIFASDKYKEYLSVMSKFHRYSFRNTLLILFQKPDASMIAGYGAWQKNFKRQVRKGEKGIKIIAPSPYKIQKEQEKIGADGKKTTETIDVTIPAYKVTTVFDVSQTDGEPLPSLGVDKLQGSVDNYKDFYAALEKISPVAIGFENIESGANGYFNRVEQRIAVQENMSELQTLKTLIHEIAHAKLHDISPEEANALPPEEQKDTHTKEVEAESVAYTVCQHYGIDTSDYTFGYVAGWSSGKELPELNSSLTVIQKTANEIISGIDEHFAELTKEHTQEKSEVQPEKAKAAKAPKKEPAVKKPSIREQLAKMTDDEKQSHIENVEMSIDFGMGSELCKSDMDLYNAIIKERSEKKPSIRKQLAENKGKSSPTKSEPTKKKEDISL
jgi:antirestriction protein ArdC